MKSRVGIPGPEFARGVYLPAEARKGRRRLYPVSAVYSAYAATVLVLGLRSRSPLLVALCFVAGGAAWTYVEYLAHRSLFSGS